MKTHKTTLAFTCPRLFAATLLWGFCASAEAVNLQVGTFHIDATPPVGSPLCDGLVPPATGVNDPLSARGIVLQADDQPPVVLVAIDWVGIGNEGHDAWREAIAEACGITPDRVCVHTLHQHDAPGSDFHADRIAAEIGLGGKLFNVDFARETIERSAEAAREALQNLTPATHVGYGAGRVEKVASNRRILGPDGNVEYVRMSSCKDQKLRDMPEGTIDPDARVVSFWQEDRPLVVLTYYATHPQSYYRTGKVSADFVGMARDEREAELPGILHIHFNGAGGNIAAGKYNDGSPETRPVLAQRLAAGMKAGWDSTQKTALSEVDFSWDTQEVALPPAEWLDPHEQTAILQDESVPLPQRLQAARALAFLQRCEAGHTTTIARLRIGEVDLLHLPGELFIEYQLAAQAINPNQEVCTAAYGDYGPGYIGTSEAYSQGGYETSRVSRVSPRVETVLMGAIEELMK